MEQFDFLTLIKESAFLLTTFGCAVLYGMAKGRYAVINLIFALYTALLISIEFPYYESLGSMDAEGGAVAKIAMFIVIVIASTILFRRHIPGDDYEPAFQNLGKKIILACMATILVMIFSFHALPVTDIITPGTPIQSLFAPKEHFFWWLILPLFVLFFA